MKPVLTIILVVLLSFHIKSQLPASVDGYIHCFEGDPIEGAIIELAPYSDTTNSNGYFYIEEIAAGTYTVKVYVDGYDPYIFWTIEILSGENLNFDIPVPCSDFEVEPMVLEVIIDPNGQTEETLNLSNSGTGAVSWEATLNIIPPGKSKDFLDVQFQYPANVSPSLTAIECDGEYFYCMSSFPGDIYKFALDGTFIESFPGWTAGGDLAYNGTYFYLGDGNMIYELDLSNQTLITTFTAPGNVDAIAWDDDQNVFYGYSWGNNLIVFDMSGAMLGNVPIGPDGEHYSGLAYDNVSEGGPYLWGYGMANGEPNTLVQIHLPTLQETGFTVNLADLLPEPLTSGSGGLFTHPDIIPGTYTLGGMVVGEWIWGLELTPAEEEWISIEPVSGTLQPGESSEMTVYFDATDLLPWTYEAEIQFTTNPNVASPVVDVSMLIEGIPMPYNIQHSVECTDVNLTWDMMNSVVPPDSFGIYRNDELICYVTEQNYLDTFQFPEIEYQYSISAVFPDPMGETWPVPGDMFIIPLPNGLDPMNFEGYPVSDSVICLSWETNACLEPDEYRLYRDLLFIATLTEPEYCDTLPGPGTYGYYVTAKYYFGESNPSNTLYILIPPTKINEINKNSLIVFPNPTSEIIYVHSFQDIKSYQLLNCSGDVLRSNKNTPDQFEINVADLMPGLYFLIAKTNDHFYLERIIVR